MRVLSKVLVTDVFFMSYEMHPVFPLARSKHTPWGTKKMASTLQQERSTSEQCRAASWQSFDQTVQCCWMDEWWR